jgi:ubiquinone/menaquinone biosynthesis C-methylase UbiE
MMKEYEKSINDHYSQSDLAAKITSALERAGKKIDTLTRDDIASMDEFHIRGRDATRELARLANLQSKNKVLDLGCGVGGPARTLAAEFGCSVTGVDLVEEYCRTAEIMTDRVGLSDRVVFHHGDIMAMPFETDSFDIAWSQHTMMNIEDKARLLSKVHRLLRNRGYFAFYEICAGSNSPIHFPVPWAGNPEISFLVTPEELGQILKATGFMEHKWMDITRSSLEWFEGLLASMKARSAGASPPLGLNMLMGETTAEKTANVVRNLREDRIRVVQGVLINRK